MVGWRELLDTRALFAANPIRRHGRACPGHPRRGWAWMPATSAGMTHSPLQNYAPLCPFIRRLVLSDFRSYAALDLALKPGLVVLNGENGAGKTNLIEAISFLCPGRGLRRAELSECARVGGAGHWSVFAELDTDGIASARHRHGAPAGRHTRAPLSARPRTRALTQSLRRFHPHHLADASDGWAFLRSRGERRRFLDRLVLAVDAEQGTRVNAMERALRNRNRLLEDKADARWLDAAEHELAELAVAVAAARAETVAHLAARIAQTKDESGPFPYAEIRSKAMSKISSAQSRRSKSKISIAPCCGRTAPAMPQLGARSSARKRPIFSSAMGRNRRRPHAFRPASKRRCWSADPRPCTARRRSLRHHADPALGRNRRAFRAARRSALFERLIALQAQVFMTGAERAPFAELEGKAQMLVVEPERSGAMSARAETRHPQSSRLYGRRKGKKLRAHHAALIEICCLL